VSLDDLLRDLFGVNDAPLDADPTTRAAFRLAREWRLLAARIGRLTGGAS
jgi:hypothetical protein